MLQLPPIPSWDGLHPLIVHFPIALLFAVPIFVLWGAIISPRRGRPLLYSALILMVLGTISTFFALTTGEAAGKVADRTPEITAAIEHHEELAENTRLAFSVLTSVFALILLVPLLRRREPTRISTTVVPLAFLILYGAGMLLLANTADQGGRLVHQLGVHSMVAASPSAGVHATTPDNE